MASPQPGDDLFRQLVESVRDYAIIALSPDGLVQTWNAGAERLMRYTADEIVGLSYDRLFTDDDRAAGQPELLLTRARDEGRAEDEGWRVRKSGSLFWAEVVMTPLYDAAGRLRGFATVTRDVTARHEAESALRQSEEFFRLLVENVRGYAIFMLSPEGRVVTWNPAAELLKGYSRSEIVGQSAERFYLPAERAAGHLQELLRRAREDGRVEDEGWRVRKDGTLFWASVVLTALYSPDGELRGFAKLTSDLSERRQAEEQRAMRLAAERAAERMSRLQGVTAALAAASRPEHLAELLGSAGVAALGAAAGAVALPVPGEDLLEVVHVTGFGPGSVELHQRISRDDPYTLAEVWRTGEALFLSSRTEARETHPHLARLAARSRYEAWAAVPLIIERRLLGVMTLSFAEPRRFDADERGFVLALGEVASQALDRADLYVRERESRAEAEAAVHAQDQFLSIASHELRTPVAAIKATAQIAQRTIARGTFDLTRFERNLEIITRGADRLTRLVEDLLDVSRLRTGQLRLRLQTQDIIPLLHEVVERYRAHDVRGHQFQLSLPDAPVELDVDASRIEQVLDNFLSNAVKYSPGGGDIRIGLDVVETAVQMWVTDQGIGLPAGQEERIFEPFGRAANASEQQIPGLGLGLAICRQLIEAHGGRVWAASGGEHHGTTFTAALPRPPASPRA